MRAVWWLVVVAGALVPAASAAQEPKAAVTGPDRAVELGDPVRLDASASEAARGRKLVAWEWTHREGRGGLPARGPFRTDGPVLELPVRGEPALAPGRHRVGLRVVDDRGTASREVEVGFEIRDTRRPTAVLDAPRSHDAAGPLELDGRRSSDPGGGSVVGYRWTLLAGGANGTLVPGMPLEADRPTLSVEPASGRTELGPGAYRVRLEVVDASGNRSDPAEVQVEVVSPRPTAVLQAPAQAELGDPLVLDGSASSAASGGTLTHWEWTHVASGSVFETATPTFAVSDALALPVGSHDFRLRVTDGAGRTSDPAATAVVVRDTRTPTAVLDAPASVEPTEPVLLDAGRSTDVGGASLSAYRWTLTQAPGPVAASPGSSVEMVVNTPLETTSPTLPLEPGQGLDAFASGAYRVRLEVVDAAGNVSQPVQHQLSVLQTAPPVAVLQAPQVVEVGEPVPLNGSSSSSPVGRPLVGYTWTHVASGYSWETETPTLDFPPENPTLPIGAHQIRLVVTDDSGMQSAPADVQVTVRDSRAPTAAGRAPVEVTVTLDATASLDPEPGRVAQYRWTRLSGSGGGWAVNETRSFSGPVRQISGSDFSGGVHEFRLVVVDESGNESVPVIVSFGVPGPG